MKKNEIKAKLTLYIGLIMIFSSFLSLLLFMGDNPIIKYKEIKTETYCYDSNNNIIEYTDAKCYNISSNAENLFFILCTGGFLFIFLSILYGVKL